MRRRDGVAGEFPECAKLGIVRRAGQLGRERSRRHRLRRLCLFRRYQGVCDQQPLWHPAQADDAFDQGRGLPAVPPAFPLPGRNLSLPGSWLTSYLKSRRRGARLLLLGFADAVGSFEVNLTLARNRANSVRDALLKAGANLDPAAILVKGYGELMPVACNSSDLGREKNRRVEVYLLDQ